MYAEIIREGIATGGRLDRTDNATVALVEEWLRCDRTALDGMSRAQLVAEARTAVADMDTDPGVARDYCEALGLVVPAWAI